MPPATEAFAAFVGGFTAAEGTFTHTRQGRLFSFAVALGATDAAMCHQLLDFFGVGHVHRSARRKPHYDDEVVFFVRRLPDLVDVVVPFMDEHLPESYKRRQYLEWRSALLHHWEHSARRVRACAVEGCEKPCRAKRLCRQHYYEAYGA